MYRLQMKRSIDIRMILEPSRRPGCPTGVSRPRAHAAILVHHGAGLGVVVGWVPRTGEPQREGAIALAWPSVRLARRDRLRWLGHTAFRSHHSHLLREPLHELSPLLLSLQLSEALLQQSDGGVGRRRVSVGAVVTRLPPHGSELRLKRLPVSKLPITTCKFIESSNHS